MVLGFILYESIELVYNVGKLTVNGAYGLYSWYYDVKEPLTEQMKLELKQIELIERLTNRIENLEHLLEDKKEENSTNEN